MTFGLFETKCTELIRQYVKDSKEYGDNYFVLNTATYSGPGHITSNVFPSIPIKIDQDLKHHWEHRAQRRYGKKVWGEAPDIGVFDKRDVVEIWIDRKPKHIIDGDCKEFDKIMTEKLLHERKDWWLTSEDIDIRYRDKLYSREDETNKRGIVLKSGSRAKIVIDSKYQEHNTKNKTIANAQIKKLISNAKMLAAEKCYCICLGYSSVSESNGYLEETFSFTHEGKNYPVNLYRINYNPTELVSRPEFNEKYLVFFMSI